ncbi:MAG: hypothetical protein JJ896_12730 [Rhodothermales bacterium]|nr:hypothetical protein [Rhodothermales bacterium]MBO6780512.1 hypothetical protein [Rhodothermales bacterium]
MMRIAAVVLVGIIAWPASGQSWLTSVAPGPRAAAMGGSVTLGLRAPEAAWVNPASAAWADGGSVSVRYRDDLAMDIFMAAAVDRFVFGARQLPSADGVSALAVSGAASHELKGFRLGAGLHLVEQDAARGQDRAMRLDLGVSRRLGSLDVGLSVVGLGRGVDAPIVPPVVPREVATVLNVSSLRGEVGPLDVAFAGHLARYQDAFHGGVGGELAYWPVRGRTFRVLGGWQRQFGQDAPTFGASYTGDLLTFSWARSEYLGATTHRFGISWR